MTDEATPATVTEITPPPEVTPTAPPEQTPPAAPEVTPTPEEETQRAKNEAIEAKIVESIASLRSVAGKIPSHAVADSHMHAGILRDIADFFEKLVADYHDGE